MSIPAGDPGPVIERLIRIETKLDVVREDQTDQEHRLRALEVDNAPGGHADHETRIRRLERSMWLIAGAAAAGGGVAGQLLAGLINH